ncbi:hypothetical protein EOD41_07455 [Mucilaginibacter limnophilus]|uniref:PKD domain-containing protein n=1 Tax=Mucilaginibacter limnophilus TaxID=1932778 RepID=A0A437MVV4_9SPHI|nr:PKD domain-containing protein [Mucilaginibacter limnophilus]RVU01785.1 hypothetical protein EOD41_07455 [Mucilaginibacter limnophilus]
MRNVNLWLAALTMLILAESACKKGGSSKPDPNKNEDVQPLAHFTWTGTQRVNAEITFANSSQYADSYKWNFGNGETSTQQIPGKVKYAQEGVYDVVLTAIKGELKSVYKQTLAIATDNKPLAHFSFTYKDNQTYAPAVVQFNNESVNGLQYEWEINGNIYHEPNPKVTFNQPGDYAVILTAINGDQQTVFTDTVNITANNNPVAKFALPYHPFPYTVNEPIQLVNLSKNADSWLWTFGTDGPPASTDEHPEVKFSKPGTYTIQLIAKKGTLQSAPRSINLKINP